MKANKNSWHTLLFKYIWSGSLPENLCPYFWEVILGLLFVIPVFFLRLINYILFSILRLLDPSYKKYDDFLLQQGADERYVENLMGICFYIAITLLIAIFIGEYHWFKWLFNAYSYDRDGATLGGFINFVAAIFIIRYFILKIWGNLSGKKNDVEKHPNIFTEFIKAKYNKYCPKIDWN